MLNRVNMFLVQEEGLLSQLQTQSLIDEEGRRSTFHYESQMDDGVSKASMMSPIPRAGQSVAYQNFDTFSQNNDQVNYQNSVEVRPTQNPTSTKMEYMKSQTEYSYNDPDNFMIQQQNERKEAKQKHRRSRESSSDSSSFDTDEEAQENQKSFEESRHHRSKKSKYRKLKKVLKNTKQNLSQTKNMLEIQKIKNESQEEKLKNLALEIEGIKRSSLENFLTNKSMQSFALNPALFNMNQQLENYAFATQRNTPEMVSFVIA